MGEIVNFIETFLSAPLQLVIILTVFSIFIYWWVKERPNERQDQWNLIAKLSEDANNAEKRREKEREDFLQSLNEIRTQTLNSNVMYEKTLENCTKVIENNSHAMENLNLQIQNNAKAMEALETKIADSLALMEVKLDDSTNSLADKADLSIKATNDMAKINNELTDRIKEGLLKAEIRGEK